MPGRPRTATKPAKTHNLRPGDYVRPVMLVEGEDVTAKMTACKITSVYQNGNIHCVSDDGSVSHHGPASGFRKEGRIK